MPRPRTLPLLAATGLALGLACSPASPPPEAEEEGGAAVVLPADPPYIRGVVTAVERDNVRVEESPADQSGTAKAVLTLTEETQVLRRSGKAALPTELREGVPVSVWVSGPVLESYPVQATARVVVLEPGPS